MTDPSSPRASGADELVAAARARLRVSRAALFLRETDGEGLVCVATAGDGGGHLWVGQTLRAGIGVAGRAVAEGRPVWSPDLLADPRIPVAPWLRERLEAEGLRSVMAAPLMAGRAVLGALGVLDAAGRAYGAEETAALAALAADAASALGRP